jgi:DNA-binding transcriptional ArsR family regulator
LSLPLTLAHTHEREVIIAPSTAEDATFRALAEPRRRAILRLVSDQELSAGAIASGFEVSRTAVSQHLTVLRDAGLVAERRSGTRRFYRARPEGLSALRELLERVWRGSLERAVSLAEAEPSGRDD